MRALVLSLLVSAVLGLFENGPDDPADAIYINAIVWTGDEHVPRAEAFAVRGNRFVAAGSRAEVERLRGPNTTVVDLKGRLVLPGLIDNHVHFLDGGLHLGSVSLRTADSAEEFSRRMEDFAATRPKSEWITGGEWDHELWEGELPTKEWIDSVTPDHPVFVIRLDGHMGLANSLALELAGIDAETKDPEGGLIVRDPVTGEPTGVVKDEAMSLIYAVIPPRSPGDEDAALARATKHALSLGITQVHDMGSFGGWRDLDVYHRAYARDDLGIRIYAFMPLSTWPRLYDLVREHGRGDDRLRWGGLKGFVDGSLGSTTAWFYEPFSDAPETSGLIVTDTSDLRQWIIEADGQNLHVAVHAIGDRANDWLLDTFREARALNGSGQSRFRIEHAQHLSREAIERFRREAVIASMQPYHAIDDGRWAEKRIGPERIRRTYAFRSLLDAGAPLTFGSDWYVAPINPMEGIYAAVTRRTIDGQNPDGWVPEQKIALEQALHAYTTANAYAGYQEDRLGRIRPAYLADFVVLDENLFEIAPEHIKDVKIAVTAVDGRIVYSREE